MQRVAVAGDRGEGDDVVGGRGAAALGARARRGLTADRAFPGGKGCHWASPHQVLSEGGRASGAQADQDGERPEASKIGEAAEGRALERQVVGAGAIEAKSGLKAARAHAGPGEEADHRHCAANPVGGNSVANGADHRSHHAAETEAVDGGDDAERRKRGDRQELADGGGLDRGDDGVGGKRANAVDEGARRDAADASGKHQDGGDAGGRGAAVALVRDEGDEVDGRDTHQATAEERRGADQADAEDRWQRPVGAPTEGDGDTATGLADEGHGREHEDERGGALQGAGGAPVRGPDHGLEDGRHDGLADGAAGHDDAQREAEAAIEPCGDGREQRRVEAGEAEEAERQVDRLDRGDARLQADEHQPEAEDGGAGHRNGGSREAVGETAGHEAAKRGADRQQGVGESGLGAKPAELGLERPDQDRDGADRPEGRGEAEGRGGDDDPAGCGWLGHLVLPRYGRTCAGGAYRPDFWGKPRAFRLLQAARRCSDQCSKRMVAFRTAPAAAGLFRIVDVADAADGADYLGFLGVRLDLAADAADADVDRAVERVPGAVVGAFEDLVAVQHPPAVLGEELEEGELHRGQRQFLAVVIEELGRGDVEPEPTEAPALATRVPGRVGRLGAAQDRLDPRLEFAQIDGLSEIVVGAHLQTEDAVHGLAGGGQHHHRHAQILAAKAAQKAEAVLTGHGDVEDQEVERRSGERAAHGTRRSRRSRRRSRACRGTRRPSRGPRARRRRRGCGRRSSGGLGQQAAGEAAEVGRGDRLLEPRTAGAVQERAGRGAHRVAGHEGHSVGKHWMVAQDSLPEAASAEARHREIAEDQRVAAGADQADRGLGRMDMLDLEALALQHLPDQLGDVGLVVDDKDPRAAPDRRGRLATVWGLGFGGGNRKADDKGGAGAVRGFGADGAVVRGDDAMAEGEADAGALADLLRREERVENAAADRLGDARTLVADAELDLTAATVVGGGDAYRAVPARLGHSVLGVGDKVDDHLSDLVGVGVDPRQVRGERQLDADAGARGAVADGIDAGDDDGVEGDRSEDRGLLPCHGQKGLHDPGAALGGGADLVEAAQDSGIATGYALVGDLPREQLLALATAISEQ